MPNDLRIMQALVVYALIGGIVIVGLLGEPELYSIGSIHVPIIFSQILAIRPPRVLHFVVLNPLDCVVLSIGLDGPVPCHWAHANHGSSRIMDVEEILRGILG
ncbi:uncharacterized protein G2W53_041927 [Senna tora]|uniref:Uncharacterized protein n=1 Tax=Senna tora TaxID=362788 RepID=A0A834SG06_9FABA|nr:uncharacterized protein G2W53_041927 [Senna tora]